MKNFPILILKMRNILSIGIYLPIFVLLQFMYVKRYDCLSKFVFLRVKSLRVLSINLFMENQ